MARLHSFLRPFLTLVAAALVVGGLVSNDTMWLAALGGVLVCVLYLLWSAVPPAPATPQARYSRNVQVMAGFLLAGFVLLAITLLREQVVGAQATLATEVVSETQEIAPGQYQRTTTIRHGAQSEIHTEQFTGRNVLTGTRSTRNPREFQAALRVQRGQIFDAKGGVLAGRTIIPGSNFVQRTYPQPQVSYLVGYYCPAIYGVTGLEAAFDAYLSGRVGSNPLLDQENDLLHRPVVGQDVYLTIDPVIQAAAQTALGQRKGGVVVLDAQTGAILAAASYPHFDPQELAFDPSADDWGAENTRIVRYWAQLTGDPGLPLFLRATQALYPPGSTFKTATLAAALDLGKARPTDVYTDTGSFTPPEPGVPPDVDCGTCRPAGHGPRYTLMEGYQWSLNVVFAQLGLQVGGDALADYARRFGYGNDFADVGLPIAPSSVASTAGFLDRPKGITGTSYGQGEMQATTLQMALIAATAAHGGDTPAPYVVDRVVNPATGATVIAATPHNLGRALSPAANATLQQMMITSVEQGYAGGARITGATVGGKTGTAETGRGTTHAWFHAFAGPDPAHLQYAIAVVVEDGGEGSRIAAPIAKQVLLAALGR